MIIVANFVFVFIPLDVPLMCELCAIFHCYYSPSNGKKKTDMKNENETEPKARTAQH